MQTKISMPGQNAYENQLIRQHRKEISNFLITQRIYTGTEVATIMKFYDRKIDIKNIIKVHTHPAIEFLTYLCTGRLEELYVYSSAKENKVITEKELEEA